MSNNQFLKIKENTWIWFPNYKIAASLFTEDDMVKYEEIIYHQDIKNGIMEKSYIESETRKLADEYDLNYNVVRSICNYERN